MTAAPDFHLIDPQTVDESFWLPSPADRAMLEAGGAFRLAVRAGRLVVDVAPPEDVNLGKAR